jgi:hypothetical protein
MVPKGGPPRHREIKDLGSSGTPDPSIERLGFLAAMSHRYDPFLEIRGMNFYF